MTVRRKVLIALGALFVLVLIALAAVPFLIKGRIAARAHAEVDNAVDAQVAWGDVGLTFFRNFPNLTLRLDDLTVVLGNTRLAGDTLATWAVDMVVDAESLLGRFARNRRSWSGPIRLDEPSAASAGPG